jgi:hypothetical protein
METFECDGVTGPEVPGSGFGFIQRELDRVQKAIALREAPDPECDARLRAISQALSWALEPTGFAAPYDTIMGTQPEPEGCSASPRPPEL